MDPRCAIHKSDHLPALHPRSADRHSLRLTASMHVSDPHRDRDHDRSRARRLGHFSRAEVGQFSRAPTTGTNLWLGGHSTAGSAEQATCGGGSQRTAWADVANTPGVVALKPTTWPRALML